MKRLFLWLCVLAAGCATSNDQQLSLPTVWRFHLGDDPGWSSSDFSDASWDTISVGKSWESQGHAGYDGYAWYRVKIVIPSSLKSEAYPNTQLKISLGKIDDGDEVFLNGKIIGQNGAHLSALQDGNKRWTRVYRISLTDPAIHWDQDNVIAVRVYDRGEDGGMYAGPYQIAAEDVSDFVQVDDQTDDFHFEGQNQVHKQIFLRSTLEGQSLSGTLQVEVRNPEGGNVLWQKSVPASFSPDSPFSYQYSVDLPDTAAYPVYYQFTDERSSKIVTASEEIPYLLTPAPGPKPRINGASVVGVRPGHPFLYRIAATGSRPMQFAADALPDGLHLDQTTGIISGSTSTTGTFPVKITATNTSGSDTRALQIKVGSTIGLTPAMGWNSWNAWGLSVNADKVKAAADAMVKQGLVNHGWTYINIDDGWEQPVRAADGEIRTNEKFPDMKALADYVHGEGLKIGIYSSPGPRTCGGFLGSWQHEAQDAHTYARWGIDYLKYDWCSYGQIAPPNPDLTWLQKPYRLMDSALHTINRDIYFSLCQYGMGDVWTWGAQVGGNSWRTTGDIRDSWQSMAGIGFHQEAAAPHSAPGHWNDPDMLVVGRVGWGPNLHHSHLTPDEQYTHISLWCLLSAPLLIGCDMSQLDDFTLNLLTNDEVLQVDQDPLGQGARQVAEADSMLIYEKALADGSKAIGVFNISSKAAGTSLSFATLGLSGARQLRDLWRQKTLGTFTGNYAVKSIPSHGVLLIRASAANP